MESFKSFYLAEAAMSPVLASNDQVRRVAALIPISDSDEAEEMLEAVYYEVIVPIAKERLDKFNRTIKKFLSKSKYRKISEKPEEEIEGENEVEKEDVEMQSFPNDDQDTNQE